MPDASRYGRRGISTIPYLPWTVGANAWAGLEASTVAGRMMEGMTDGSIVLMHPNAETVQAVEIVLDRLSGAG